MGTACAPYNRGLTEQENNKTYVIAEAGVECPTVLLGD